MVNAEIARAIANIAIFLEFTPENILDEDASMQAMEQLAADLQNLDEDSRKQISSKLYLIAPNYEGETRNFVAGLSEALGIE